MVETPAITARKSLSEGLNSAIPTVGSNFQPLMSLRAEVLSGRVFSDGVFLLWADE